MVRKGPLSQNQCRAARPGTIHVHALCSYLWIHPSLQSHTWSPEVPHTAQEAGRSGPRDGSRSQVFSRNGVIQDLWPQGQPHLIPFQLAHTPLQLEQNKMGACRSAHCLGHWDPLQVCLSRLWVLVEGTQPYLISCERFVAGRKRLLNQSCS